MIEAYLFISFFVLQIMALIWGVLIRRKADQMLEYRRVEDSMRFSKRMARFMALVALLGLIFAGVLAGFIGLAVYEEWSGMEIFFPSLWYALNLVILGMASLSLFQATSVILRPDDPIKHQWMHRLSISLRRQGTALFFIPLLGSLLLPVVVVVIPFLIALVFLIANKRKKDQGTVLWAMSIAMRSGVPVEEELEAVRDSLSRKQRIRVNQLADRLREGESLENAVTAIPLVVPHWAALEIQVAAENGALQEGLRDAAVRHTSSQSLGEQGPLSITAPVLYLVVVPWVAGMILYGIMIWIIPKFKEIFEGFDTELPDLTEFVIETSDLTSQYMLLFIPMFLLFFIGSLVCSVGYIRGWGETNLPFGGRWFRRLDVPEILRNLGTTVREQKRLDVALGTLCEHHQRKSVQRALESALTHMQQGSDCWSSLWRSGLITSDERTVLQSAERSGNLPWALGQVSEAIESRLAYRWRAALEFLQPAFVIGVGAVCFVIVLGLFLPLIKLVNDLS